MRLQTVERKTPAQLKAGDAATWERLRIAWEKDQRERELARRTWADPRQVAEAEAAMRRVFPSWGRG